MQLQPKTTQTRHVGLLRTSRMVFVAKSAPQRVINVVFLFSARREGYVGLLIICPRQPSSTATPDFSTITRACAIDLTETDRGEQSGIQVCRRRQKREQHWLQACFRLHRVSSLKAEVTVPNKISPRNPATSPFLPPPVGFLSYRTKVRYAAIRLCW